MTLTEAPPRPDGAHDSHTVRFEPPATPRTPRPATAPDPGRPGAIGSVALAVRSVVSAEVSTDEDPRIAARRAVVEDEADRVRLRPILTVLALLVGVVVILGVLWSPLFSVQRITIVGASAADRPAILAAASIQDGTPLVTVDVAAARARIAALPLIDGVRVERIWPRSVLITVATRTSIAAVRVPGAAGLAVVDAQGRVIAVSASVDPAGDPRTADLPVVRSATSATLVPGARIGPLDRGSVRAVAALDGQLRSSVRTVHRDGRVVHLQLSGPGRFADVDVVLGQPNDLNAKSLALRSVLSEGSASGGPITEIDVSVPDAPILRMPVQAG